MVKSHRDLPYLDLVSPAPPSRLRSLTRTRMRIARRPGGPTGKFGPLASPPFGRLAALIPCGLPGRQKWGGAPLPKIIEKGQKIFELNQLVIRGGADTACVRTPGHKLCPGSVQKLDKKVF